MLEAVRGRARPIAADNPDSTNNDSANQLCTEKIKMCFPSHTLHTSDLSSLLFPPKNLVLQIFR